MQFKTFEELQNMNSDDVKLEMLKLWNKADFNTLSDEEEASIVEQLKMCREIIKSRHNNKYY